MMKLIYTFDEGDLRAIRKVQAQMNATYQVILDRAGITAKCELLPDGTGFGVVTADVEEPSEPATPLHQLS